MLRAGFVGLPNVGKSTLFNALLSKQVADAANYPFCTIEPNVGVVEVPDSRLGKLANVVNAKNIIPSAIEFVDIAGLVEGAHKGEGLGNKFLSHIREVDAIIYVLRNFNDENVTRAGSTTPIEDFNILQTELLLADLTVIEKQIRPAKKLSQDEEHRYNGIEKIRTELENGSPARNASLIDEELHEIKSFNFLTLKPMIVVLNSDEEDLSTPVTPIENAETIKLCAKLEAQMTGLSIDEKNELLSMYDVDKPILDTLIETTYKTLGLMTFLTAGEKEVRAWPIPIGTYAPQAAGTIHTDFEKAFIKAKITQFSDFIEHNGWIGAKDAGKIRMEGKEYIMQEGDVVEFMVNT